MMEGLMLREYLAGQAMQGLIPAVSQNELALEFLNSSLKNIGKSIKEWIAETSVSYADTMIAELKKPKEPLCNKLRARVISTGKIVLVDDAPIDGIYNMWHTASDGQEFHDDELEFIDERLQKRDK